MDAFLLGCGFVFMTISHEDYILPKYSASFLSVPYLSVSLLPFNTSSHHTNPHWAEKYKNATYFTCFFIPFY